MLNKVLLIGRLGKDPDVKDLKGKKLAKFSLATSETYKNAKGEKVTNTEWHNVSCWDGTASIVEKYFKKGSSVFVEGKIKYESYDNDKGEKVYITNIVANKVLITSAKEGDNTTSETT